MVRKWSPVQSRSAAPFDSTLAARESRSWSRRSSASAILCEVSESNDPEWSPARAGRNRRALLVARTSLDLSSLAVQSFFELNHTISSPYPDYLLPFGPCKNFLAHYLSLSSFLCVLHFSVSILSTPSSTDSIKNVAACPDRMVQIIVCLVLHADSNRIFRIAQESVCHFSRNKKI